VGEGLFKAKISVKLPVRKEKCLALNREEEHCSDSVLEYLFSRSSDAFIGIRHRSIRMCSIYTVRQESNDTECVARQLATL